MEGSCLCMWVLVNNCVHESIGAVAEEPRIREIITYQEQEYSAIYT